MQEKHAIEELQVFRALGKSNRSNVKSRLVNSYVLKVFLFAVFISLVTYIYLDARADRNKLGNITSQSGDIIKSADLPKTVNNPPGLRFFEVAPNSFLSVQGVIDETNKQRTNNGLLALTTNTTLNLSALRKAQDMLSNQYFEHESPDGVDVAGLAQNVGYEYIVIGENLALGNFADNPALLNGWMNSPGHRANILNEKYTEIGVSVLRGNFEGTETWLAVQHFGFPTSACPEPNGNLKSTIDQNNSLLEALATELINLKADLDKTDKNSPSYSQKVDTYNTKVNNYNTLLEDTKNIIAQYNEQINNFNSCAN